MTITIDLHTRAEDGREVVAVTWPGGGAIATSFATLGFGGVW